MIECFAMMVQLNDALKINTLLSHWLRMDGNIFKQFIKQSASYFNSIMCIIVLIQKAVQNALSSKRALYGFLMCVMIL